MNLEESVGTNYYAKIDRNDGYKLGHLGKACYKLRFAFRWNPEYYKDFEGFMKFVKNKIIINHFGRLIDTEFLIKQLINGKQGEASIAEAYKKIGKRNLVRVVKEYKKNKFVAEHHFIDEDFGIEVSTLS